MHLAAEPVSVQRQQGVAAGGQYETQALGPADQVIQAFQNLSVVEDMRIVDDYDELRCLVRHAAEQRLDQIKAGGLRNRSRRPAVGADDRIQGGGEQLPEPPGLSVRSRGSQPRDLSLG